MTQKRNKLSDLFRDITPEKREKFKKERLERKSKLTLAYQLGFYVGEQIVDKHLPTLSVDMLKTRKNISVTCAEGDECRRLDDVWYKKRMESRDDDKHSETEWNALRAYHEMLEAKYLPSTVECHFSLLNINEENMSDFKKGIGDSLWDCDCSHYSTKPEDIEVKADEEGWFTIITLKRD